MLDVCFRGGRVVDGAGNPWFEADVGIRDGRIVAVGRGRRAGRGARSTRDGLAVCPGFIDMHTHSDVQLLANPEHECKVLQGVTLDVLGQDGLGFAPVDDHVLELLRRQLAGWNDDPPGFDWSWRSVAEYLERFDDRVAINVAYLIPHGTVRLLAVAPEDRAPTRCRARPDARARARGPRGGRGRALGRPHLRARHVRHRRRAGRAVPGDAPDRRLLLPAPPQLRPAGARGATRDSIEIARPAGVPLHLAHAHLGFDVNRGRAPELLGDDRRRARRRRRRHARQLPLPRGRHVPARDPARAGRTRAGRTRRSPALRAPTCASACAPRSRNAARRLPRRAGRLGRAS